MTGASELTVLLPSSTIAPRSGFPLALSHSTMYTHFRPLNIPTGSLSGLPVFGVSYVDPWSGQMSSAFDAGSLGYPSLLATPTRGPLLTSEVTRQLVPTQTPSTRKRAGKRQVRTNRSAGAEQRSFDPSSPHYFADAIRAASLAPRPVHHHHRPRPYERNRSATEKDRYTDKITPAVRQREPTWTGSPDPAVETHYDTVHAELKTHSSRDVPSFVPLTTNKVRLAYVRPAQLPPPGPLLIDGRKLDKPLPLLPPLAEPEFSMVFTHTSWAGTKKKGQSQPT